MRTNLMSFVYLCSKFFFQKLINRIIHAHAKLLNLLEERKYKKNFLKLAKKSLVFDIGYNRGDFSRALIKNYKFIKIIGVEANPEIIDKFYESSSIKKLNFIVSNTENKKKILKINTTFDGISTAASNSVITKSRFYKGSEKIPKLNVMYDKKVTVKTITLDSLIKKYGVPNLIKIDVEGYEYQVIKGLKKKAKKITFEWHEEHFDDLLKIIKYLKKIGYKKFGVVGWFSNKNELNNKILFSNAGDPYLIEPDYFPWEEICLSRFINKKRKVNFGMIWANI
jgi:FkbM family methyltransferase